MEVRRTWMDRSSQRSRDEESAVHAWVRGSLLKSYDDVVLEALPQHLIDLLPKD